MTSIVSLNGQRLTPSPDGVYTLPISPFDRGFTLGDGLFETIRVERGLPWYLDRHLVRLDRAARRFGLTMPAALRLWVDDVVRAAPKDSEGQTLRVTITRGESTTPGLAGAVTTEHPTVVITLQDGPVFPTTTYDRGVTARIASGARNALSATAGYKTTSYAEAILALRDAVAAGFDDAIFLDTAGFVSEATASNVFVILGDVLITPAITYGILPGITRAVVIELARQLHVSVAEREVDFDELVDADEAFLTSSLRGIMPLVRVNERTLGNGIPGALTHRIMRAYAQAPDRI